MKSLKKFTAAAMAVAIAASATGCSQGKSQLPEINPRRNDDGNYNLLLITVDQEHYFSEFPEGTNYKARQLLQEIGTTFEKHYACSNMSTSSRSVIYTGTHITDTKMLDNTDFDWQGAMSEDLVTIADRMNEAGYYSAYKGKWHMGNASILEASENPLTDLSGYGFADWGTDGDYIGKAWEGYEIDPIITADSVEWLKEKGMALNREGQSFFLSINMINPHDIMNLTTEECFVSTKLDLREPPSNKVYEKTYDVPLPDTWQDDLSGTVEAVRAYKSRWSNQTGSVSTEEEYQSLQNYYFNCIQDNDNTLSLLLTALDNMGLFDNTIIVFTADHGEMQGSHGLKGKGGFIYENNIHVPLIIYHPDYEGGRRVSSVTSHMDLAPTFLDMTALSPEKKAEIAEGLNGHSLMPLLGNPEASVRDGHLFCYEMLSFAAGIIPNENGTTSYNIDNRRFVRAIVTEQYKFARYFTPKEFNTPLTMEELLASNDLELYDLKNDPNETNNLALDMEANWELILEMNEKLNALIADEIGVDDGSEFKEMIQNYLESMNRLDVSQ